MDTTQVASKADIKNLVTKKELSSVKADTTSLKQEVKFLRKDFLRLEERVENLEEGQKRLETKVDAVEERLSAKLDKMMNTLDGFVGVVDDLRTDNTVGAHHTRELQKRVDDHEERLRVIETTKHAA